MCLRSPSHGPGQLTPQCMPQSSVLVMGLFKHTMLLAAAEDLEEQRIQLPWGAPVTPQPGLDMAQKAGRQQH